MNDIDTYLHDLSAALTERGLDEDRTRQSVDEVRGHLADTGRTPVQEFGPAGAYADALITTDPESAGPGQHDERRTFRATATDEMGILADLGRDGWELTGVRDFGLHARRPASAADRHTWRYERRTAIRREPIVEEMAADGWKPCGRWVIFHYFKKVDEAA